MPLYVGGELNKMKLNVLERQKSDRQHSWQHMKNLHRTEERHSLSASRWKILHKTILKEQVLTFWPASGRSRVRQMTSRLGLRCPVECLALGNLGHAVPWQPCRSWADHSWGQEKVREPLWKWMEAALAIHIKIQLTSGVCWQSV